ncbi:MAG: MurR/RpiR family transcriptional regulator [Eubacteriales bacterium]|jgi:DNA-binding MurR/RpiR family transcriptional regulator|nr:MurR/RpiR family transcriptional regulator [Eubacteriales bacterium]MDD3197201.1 MurR/RpiR family transcriptional regulator [Eubacteriales bacterium]MDD3502568.1 MurR/RpiR family transcriptional regulator [Eubacteriales bacterium]MDD4681690.1 MurR/RpiR family transcriptional regulator [Eubacteriales bacterium]
MYSTSNSLMNRISQQMSSMSKGQKSIASFILNHYEQAAYLTAARIGEEAGVSESTVVRFAMELGFEGYPHFQKELQEELKVRLTSAQRMKASFKLAGREDILGAVLQSDIEKLRRTSDKLDREQFNQAVDAILSARRIYILGVRSAAPLASFLGFYFNLIFDNIRLVHTTSVSEMFEQILPVGKGDVVVAISFPRYSKRTIKAMTYARSTGATVVAITDKAESPVSENSDISLLAPSDMMSFVDSLVAPLSVINALIAAIGFKRQEHVIETLEKLEHIWDEYDVYDKGDINAQEDILK